MERIVLVHPFLLHYHFARLQALADACRQAGASMVSLELCSYSDQYRSLFEDQERGFDNRVLFREQSLERVPREDLWRPVREALDGLQPDVVFIYGYSLDVMRRIRTWAGRNGAGVVLISDSNEFDRPRRWLAERLKSLFVSRVDAGFAGGTSASLYLQKLGLPGERIVPGYDVVDNQLFWQHTCASRSRLPQIREKWGLPADCFLYVGRIIPEKNLGRLLAAYTRYAGLLGSGVSPWDLVLCGSGPDEEDLRRTAAQLPRHIQEHIRFCGLVRQPDLVDYYACASCLVLPSVSESWGLVVNEALACELPVLVSRRAGCAADLVREGETGWTFDPHDVDRLAGLMVDVHRMDGRARAGMGERGRQLISGWDLNRFAQGALESARIASERHHRQRSHSDG